MASSRGTSNGPDSVDVLAVMLAFEEINQVDLVIEMRIWKTTKLAVLEVKGKAWQKKPESGEAKLLAFRKSDHGFHSPQSMEAVILQLLYGIDADLAAGEFATAVKKP